MRITFVTPFASLAGGQRVIAAYAKQFHDKGHEVTVVSAPVNRRYSWRQRIAFLLGLDKPLPPPVVSPLFSFLKERHIHAVSAEGIWADEVPDGDVVIATWWKTAEWVSTYPASKGRKFYLLQDYEVFNARFADRVVATYQMELQKIAVSDYIRKSILGDHLGVGEIAVIPNAVDLAQFQTPVRGRQSVPTVGFVLSYEPRKNVMLAIDALKLVKEQCPALRAVAFGRDALREDPALPDWISFTHAPAQQDIPKLYGGCDLWLFTTLREGFGLPVLEAMACRTPVLATDAGAAPDLIDGTNGEILPKDPQAFAAAMLRFLEMSDADWRACSDAAYETAQRWTWSDAAERFLKLMDDTV